MQTTKRAFLINVLRTWIAPSIICVTLPSHAQTSCTVDPAFVPQIDIISVGDKAGKAPIDPIDIARSTSCTNIPGLCTRYDAFGSLPPGLTLSDDGFISGTYNASGDELFKLDIGAYESNGCTVTALGLDLTILDEG